MSTLKKKWLRESPIGDYTNDAYIEYVHEKVREIHFVKNFSKIEEGSHIVWDPTEEQDNSAVAIYEKSTQALYISTKGQNEIFAPVDSDRLFAEMDYLGVIDGLELLNTSKVVTMSLMFINAGANEEEIKISGMDTWDVSNVINMESMFMSVGEHAKTCILSDLSNWNVSHCRYMQHMFAFAGAESKIWKIGNLSKWDMSNVEMMQMMFCSAGTKATEWSIGDLTNWNVSQVRSIDGVFAHAGENAKNFNVGDLSAWNLKNVRTYLLRRH